MALSPLISAPMPDGSVPGGRYPPWVAPLRVTGTRPPLFCACGGDGDATVYRDLALALPADQPVFAFGLPTLADDAAFPSVEQLAATYVQTVRTIQAEGPYYLCGHSLGGLVAYETAAILARAGAEVRLIALIDVLHPAYKRQMSRRDRLRFKLTYLENRLKKYARSLDRGRLDQTLRDAAAALYGRAKRFHWRVVRIVFGRLGRVPPALINSNALVLTAAWHRYEAKDHDLPLIMFNALERPAEFRYDETLGWRACVSRPCTIHFVPGDHYTLLRPPHAQVLAECLVPYLNQPRNMAA